MFPFNCLFFVNSWRRRCLLFPFFFFAFALHSKVSFQTELIEKSRLMLSDQIRIMKFPLCRAMDDIFGIFYDANMTPRWTVNLEHHEIKSLWWISEQRTLFGSTTLRNSQKNPKSLHFFVQFTEAHPVNQTQKLPQDWMQCCPLLQKEIIPKFCAGI